MSLLLLIQSTLCFETRPTFRSVLFFQAEMTHYDIVGWFLLVPFPADIVRLQNDDQAIGFAHAIMRLELRKWAQRASPIHVYRGCGSDLCAGIYTKATFVAAWVPDTLHGELGCRLIHPEAEGRAPEDRDLQMGLSQRW